MFGRAAWAVGTWLPWGLATVVGAEVALTFLPHVPTPPVWSVFAAVAAGLLCLGYATPLYRAVEEGGRAAAAAASSRLAETNVFRRYAIDHGHQEAARLAVSRRVPQAVWRISYAAWAAMFLIVVSSLFRLTGNPEVIDGRYYSDDHGALTPLTRAEYDHLLQLHARAFGGMATAALVGAGVMMLMARTAAASGDRSLT
jgi:hypothetical protein